MAGQQQKQQQQQKLQQLTEEFQVLQSELQTVTEGRQQLESQQQENNNVQQEFEKIKNNTNVYKLVGPVLLKQDRAEAMMTVNGRLEYIEKEITRIERQMGEIQERIEKKKVEIITVQTGMQQLQQDVAG